MRRCYYLTILALLAIIPLASASAERAPGNDHVGLVVAFDTDSYIVITVPTDGRSPTGLELLQDSRIDLVHDGGLICRLATVGCSFPDQPCICDGPNYWSYWLLDDAGWDYSGKGASARTLSPGDIDGWVWGKSGTVPPEIAATAVFDADRIAPRLPLSTEGGLQIAFQGDQNDDATVTAQVATSGGPVPLSVERNAGVFAISTQGLPVGRHTVSLSIDDPDGVNGMATMAHQITVNGTARYYSLVPLVVSSAPKAGSRGLPRINHMLY